MPAIRKYVFRAGIAVILLLYVGAMAAETVSLGGWGALIWLLIILGLLSVASYKITA